MSELGTPRWFYGIEHRVVAEGFTEYEMSETSEERKRRIALGQPQPWVRYRWATVERIADETI